MTIFYTDIISNRNYATNLILDPKTFEVTVEEALIRLERQDDITDINNTLIEKYRDSFVGLWVQHTPTYAINMMFTDIEIGQSAIADIDPILHELVNLKISRVSLEQLKILRQKVSDILYESKIAIATDIDIENGTVEILTTNADSTSTVLETDETIQQERIVILEVEGLSEPQTDFFGGLSLTTCTSGFTVKSNDNRIGVTTAAHCQNNGNESFGGFQLSWQNGLLDQSTDAKWLTAPYGLEPRNIIRDGPSTRFIWSKASYAENWKGLYVCKYGRTTNLTCGTIESNTHTPWLSGLPNPASTWILVRNWSERLSDNGDSGGPWFSNNKAYGIHHGAYNWYPYDAIYMSVEYLNTISVEVLTTNVPQPHTDYQFRADNGANNKCIGLNPGSATPLAQLHLWTCNSNSTQKWRFVQQDGYYTIRPRNNLGYSSTTGLCVAPISGLNAVSGDQLNLWNCNNKHSQHWGLDDQWLGLGWNDKIFRNRHHQSMCMQPDGTNDYSPVNIVSCSSWGKWHFNY